MLADLKYIHKFAVKWQEKFSDEKINYNELVDHYFADDCKELGFKMDCGNSFREVYGDAGYKYAKLNKIIDEVTDVKLLGSALYSRWRYFNHWAYRGDEILELENRSWFILALSRLSVLTENPYLFKGVAKKIKIVSNEIIYGPYLEPSDRVEQHITINSAGRVWFTSYDYGEGFGKYVKKQSRNYSIEKTVAENVLKKVAIFFSKEQDLIYATDVGTWEMELTNTEGEKYKFNASLFDNFEVDGVDLSDLIRDSVGIDDLYVFDGNYKPNKVKRITIDYHRTSKNICMKNISEDDIDENLDYTEQLIIDRETESIEHVQNQGKNYTISHKFNIKDRVARLLNDLDADYLFDYIEGNTPDDIDTPNETKEYIITVEFNKNLTKVIKGTFDKKGLPDDFGDFAEKVICLMKSFGTGEILDPSNYEKLKRQKNDYIFCSVIFDEGIKSYYYITDDESIDVGDFVLVPVRGDGHIAEVEVVNIEYFSDDSAPLPIDKTKHIIRKSTIEDYNLY